MCSARTAVPPFMSVLASGVGFGAPVTRTDATAVSGRGSVGGVSLSRNPAAPACTASATYSSSRHVVRITTAGGAGSASRVRPGTGAGTAKTRQCAASGRGVPLSAGRRVLSTAAGHLHGVLPERG